MTRLEIHPTYESLRDALERLPARFEQGEGDVLYKGRNEIRLFTIDGQALVAKRYKRFDLLKRMAYTLLRPSKAERAFRNAAQLRRRGFRTPHEVAFLELGAHHCKETAYYVCEWTDGKAIKGPLREQKPYDHALAERYGRFVAQLHEAGIIHRDLNATNVLYTSDGGFELIDINRMKFYPEGRVPSRKACMENLTLFSECDDLFRHVVTAYVEARGWDAGEETRALRIKQRHDRAWRRRKRLTHWLKGKRK